MFKKLKGLFSKKSKQEELKEEIVENENISEDKVDIEDKNEEKVSENNEIISEIEKNDLDETNEKTEESNIIVENKVEQEIDKEKIDLTKVDEIDNNDHDNDDDDEIIVFDAEDVEIDEDEFKKYFEYEETREKGTINWVKRLKQGLSLTRGQLVGKLESLVKGKVKFDEELIEDIEQILFEADLGVNTVQKIMDELEERIGEDETTDADAIKDILRSRIERIVHVKHKELNYNVKPLTVILVIGVNGVGKTTTIAKLAYKFKNEGKSVIVAAGDTFRAGAIEQLALWARRIKIECIKHDLNADSAAVVFDAVKAAKARKKDILIIDTAGRLHTKYNLMEELKKVRKIISREVTDAPHETFLVLDSTTGQNALIQARAFKDMIDFSGIVATKLDGTAKGGVIIGISDELEIPVRYIGIGEKMQDLREFVAEDFVNALFE